MADIKTNFSVSGEKEYKQAIANINNGLKVLNSEMKLVESQYSANADSVEALTAKNDVLERKILSQKEKVEVLETALKSAAEAYGEADAKTMRWQEQLNRAQTELNKMTDEFKNNEKEIQNSSDSFLNLDGAIDKVTKELGKTLPDGVSKAVGSLGKISASSAIVVAGIAALIAVLVEAEKQLYSITIAAAETADTILTLSQQTSLSTETLQEWSYAAELIDISFDTVESSMRQLINNMQATKNGTGEAQEAFQALGVSVIDTDGNLRNAEEVFYELIDALGEVENYTERDAYAMDIFGESAQKLNPLIVQGSERLEELGQEAKDTGYVLSDLAINNLVAVDDALQRLNNTEEALKKQTAAEFAPVTEKALTTVNNAVGDIGESFLKSGIVDSFASILDSSISLIDPLTSLAKVVLPALDESLSLTADIMALIADTANVIVGLFTLDFDRIKTGLGLNTANGQYSNQQKRYYQSQGYSYDYNTGNWNSSNYLTSAQIEAAYQKGLQDGSAVGMSYEVWFENYKSQYFGQNASGNSNWRGGLTLVGENGPEIVSLPEGSQIINSQETRDFGSVTYNITIDAKSVKEFNDIIKIAQNARWMNRMGVKN